MKIVSALLFPCVSHALAQDDGLTEILSNGKAIHFQDFEQKAKFDAAQVGVTAAAAAPVKTADEQLLEWSQAPQGDGPAATVNAHSRCLWFKVLHINREGIIANVSFAQAGRTFTNPPPPDPASFSKQTVYIRCDAGAGWQPGMLFLAWAYRDGTHHEKLRNGGEKEMMRLYLNGQILRTAAPQPTATPVHFGETALDHH